jgi:hypothetical protein
MGEGRWAYWAVQKKVRRSRLGWLAGVNWVLAQNILENRKSFSIFKSLSNS